MPASRAESRARLLLGDLVKVRARVSLVRLRVSLVRLRVRVRVRVRVRGRVRVGVSRLLLGDRSGGDAPLRAPLGDGLPDEWPA